LPEASAHEGGKGGLHLRVQGATVVACLLRTGGEDPNNYACRKHAGSLPMSLGREGREEKGRAYLKDGVVHSHRLLQVGCLLRVFSASKNYFAKLQMKKGALGKGAAGKGGKRGCRSCRAHAVSHQPKSVPFEREKWGKGRGRVLDGNH